MRINFHQRRLSSLLSSSSASSSPLSASLSSSHLIVSDENDRLTHAFVQQRTVMRVARLGATARASAVPAISSRPGGQWIRAELVTLGYGPWASSSSSPPLSRYFMLFDCDKCTYVIGSDGFVRVPPSRLSTSLWRFSYFYTAVFYLLPSHTCRPTRLSVDKYTILIHPPVEYSANVIDGCSISIPVKRRTLWYSICVIIFVCKQHYVTNVPTYYFQQCIMNIVKQFNVHLCIKHLVYSTRNSVSVSVSWIQNISKLKSYDNRSNIWEIFNRSYIRWYSDVQTYN